MSEEDLNRIVVAKGAMMLLSEYMDELSQMYPKVWSKTLKYHGNRFQAELDQHINRFYGAVSPEEEIFINNIQDVIDNIFKGLGKKVVDELLNKDEK